MNRMIQLKQTTPVILVVLLLCFGVLQGVQAVVPPPDGGYPNFNTAEGQSALFSLTTASANTAVGWSSLFSNTEGSFNTAAGAGALLFNTSDENTAFGTAALLFNITGFRNTAVGVNALVNNTGSGVATPNGDPGSLNTAVGHGALSGNTLGSVNTAVGVSALLNNTTGNGNIAVGPGAGNLVTTANSVTCIGSSGGNLPFSTWIANIYGVPTQSGTTAPVVVSDAGQLGTIASSERFKKDISTMEKASEAILSLRPVTFHYKSDVKDAPQFGLIAEEVAKVNPALVLPDKEGRPYTVRYDAVNAMLLNEFLKEHRKNEEQQAIIAQLKSMVKKQEAANAEQQKQIESLTAGLQKVSAQIEASKFATGRILRGGPAPQVVKNP